MQYSLHPNDTVQALLQTDLINQQTKQVLQQRMDSKPLIEPSFFSVDEFETLKAVCRRLIPQQRQNPIDIAGQLDADIAANKGNGWRYNNMPPDQEAFKLGINGINETSINTYNKKFINLQEAEQDDVLANIQNGNAAGETWHLMPGKLFFEELLSRSVEIYYSHPLAKDEIGDVSYADAHGWQHIQLNEREMHEPLPVGEPHV